MLKAIRKERGLTQEQLAERLGITQAHVSEVERGKAMPSLPLLLQWTNAIGANILTLLREAGLVAPDTVEVEQEIAALIEQYPPFADLFAAARELFNDDPASLHELATFAEYLLERRRKTD